MPAYPLTVRVTETPGGFDLAAAGDVDISNQEALAAPLLAAAVRGPVRLDLTAVEYIDSAGLRAILEAQKAARQAGTPGLSVTVARGRQVAAVLRLSRIHQILPVTEAPP